MLLLQQITQGVTLLPFFLIPFLFLIALLIIYAVRKAVKNRSDNSGGPFEQVEGRKLVHRLKTSSLKTRLVVAVIIIVVAVSGFIVVGQLPVHRTNIEYSDPSGDVTDADIDIVKIRSYLSGTELYLQLTVAGSIVENNATITYQYNMIVVARRISEDTSAHVYRLSYENGSMAVSSISAHAYVDGPTLTIVVPISMFLQGDYMIGLEGTAQTAFGEDNTAEDRDGEVAHLLF